MPLLFMLHPQASLDIAWVSDILNALGVKRRILTIKRPALLQNVISPEPWMQHSFQIYPAYQNAHLKIAETILDRRSMPSYGPVYLSRSGLADTQRTGGETELELENILRRRGFAIIRPETLSFADQVAIFNSSPLIVGMTGSAFHTALFSRMDYRGTLVILTEPKIFPRYVLVDSIKQYRVAYINCLNRPAIRGANASIDVAKALQLMEEANIL
jgi:capsular polysaccharide biosynthesis protein